jgi:predicted Zn-dependent protease
LDHSLVDSGLIVAPVASKRDAARYGLAPTGSGLGSISQLPATGLGKLAIAPTHETLVDLLDGEPALMPWFVAGGDCTRAGDLGMPVQVLMRVEADGTVSGRYDGCTLSGSVYEALGADLLGISAERLDPDSEEPFLLTHMAVC